MSKTKEDLVLKVEIFLLENRDSLLEKDVLLLEECIQELRNLSQLRGEKNLDLRNKIVIEAIQILTKFFLSDF